MWENPEPPEPSPAIPTVRAGCWGSPVEAKLQFGLTCSLMPSFCTIPPRRPSPTFAEMICQIIGFWRGIGPDWRERAREARMVEALAEELEEGDSKGKGKRRAGDDLARSA